METYVWTLDQKVLVSVLHTLAIITGVFRLSYRWHTSRFWWEDAWAVITLLLDIVSLVCVWMLQSRSVIAALWMEAIILTSGLWAARMSMITSIIRITNHQALFKCAAYATAVAFCTIWVTLLVLIRYDCDTRTCYLEGDDMASQLVTDGISDILLVILPLSSLRGVQIERSRSVLLVSSFASSICITIVSIAHSVLILLPYTPITLIFAHVKTALAVIICNVLVIVTFIYRLWHRNDVDPDGVPTESSGPQFTSIISGWRTLSGVLRSTSSPGTSSRQPPFTPDVDTP